ncbi:MAG: DUF3299 domain-containing protein [Hyphomicrobiaceae bacterium]|nr:DUF3299 domain-containing protein [Hyphomicrobiaceae bacterium]
MNSVLYISKFVILYFVIAIIALISFTTKSALPIERIDWANLVPAMPPIIDPLNGLTQDQRFDIETISWARSLKGKDIELVQNQQGIKDAKIYEERFKRAGIDVDKILIRYKDWIKEVEARQKLINKNLDGKEIRMPGYLLPLEFSEDGETDFLLVPYVGACIHVPPPPANQIVFVRLSSKFRVTDLYTAVWITGIMKTKPSNKVLYFVDGSADISIGYYLNGTTVVSYKER